MMPVPETLQLFLENATSIAIGDSEINFLPAADLAQEQIGYSVDAGGKSLVTGKEDDWQNEWLVIAKDHLGDPIFVDADTEELTVLTAPDGEGTWEPIVIADSLENFKTILELLQEYAQQNQASTAAAGNALRQKLMNKIEKKNPTAITWYWDDFLDNA